MLTQLREIMRSPPLLEQMIPSAIKLDDQLDEAKVTVAMTQLESIWDELFPAEQDRIVRLLVEKVIVSPDEIEVRMRLNGLETVTRELIAVTERHKQEVA